MDYDGRSIFVAVLITSIVWMFLWDIGAVWEKQYSSKRIQDCYNAGNKPIPCVEAVLGPQN